MRFQPGCLPLWPQILDLPLSQGILTASVSHARLTSRGSKFGTAPLPSHKHPELSAASNPSRNSDGRGPDEEPRMASTGRPLFSPNQPLRKENWGLRGGGGRACFCTEETEFEPRTPPSASLWQPSQCWGGLGYGSWGWTGEMNRAAISCLYASVSTQAVICSLSPAHTSALWPPPRVPKQVTALHSGTLGHPS